MFRRKEWKEMVAFLRIPLEAPFPTLHENAKHNHAPPSSTPGVVYGNGTTPVGTFSGFLGDVLYLEASHRQSEPI